MGLLASSSLESIGHLIYAMHSKLVLLELSGCLNSDQFRLPQLGSLIVKWLFITGLTTMVPVLDKNEMANWVEEQDNSMQY